MWKELRDVIAQLFSFLVFIGVMMAYLLDKADFETTVVIVLVANFVYLTTVETRVR